MTRDLPAAFAEFSEARKNGFLRVKALKEQGKLIAGTFCTFTPVEILEAAGLIPVSLCGMSDETIAVAETRLPKNLCPLIKSSYGFALSDKCPYTYFADLIIGETTCDGKKKMYELLGELKDVYVLRLPQGPDRGALEVWAQELRRFIAFLEERFSIKITDEALRRAVHERNLERQSRLELMNTLKLTPPPASGYQLYKVLDGAGFMFNRAEVITKLDEVRQATLDAFRQGARPVSEQAKRILVTGCPAGGILDKTIKCLEEHGATVVCFENCTGMKQAMGQIDEGAEDIISAIAERYLDIGCAIMSPDKHRLQVIKELAAEFRAEGIVELDLQACTPYIVETYSIRKLAEEIGLPYLALETDYGSADSGQLSTRIEAYLEMI